MTLHRSLLTGRTSFMSANVFRKVGLLTIDEPPYASVSNVITNVRQVGQECVQLSADEINKQFPGLNLSPEECGAIEPSSGFIQADLALKSLQVRCNALLIDILKRPARMHRLLS